MLVVRRRVEEALVIDGRTTVKVVEIRGQYVRLGIEAPKDVSIHRHEVQMLIDSQGGRHRERDEIDEVVNGVMQL